MTRRGGNSDDVGVSGTNSRNQGAKINTEFVDRKAKLGKSVVDVLKTGLNSISSGIKSAGGILSKSIG